MRAHRGLIVILLVIGLLLAGCGKKGPVRPLTGPLPVNSVTKDQKPLSGCCN